MNAENNPKKDQEEALVASENQPTSENEESLVASELGLQQAITKMQEELGIVQDRYLRLAAEFENYKRRTEREQQTSLKFANERLLRDLLPVLDNLEHALQAADAASLDGIATGVKMVFKQLVETLERFGVQSFSALGKPFDPSLHEAMLEREDDSAEPGTVIEEYQKGYMLHERLVRPARVVVAKAKTLL